MLNARKQLQHVYVQDKSFSLLVRCCAHSHFKRNKHSLIKGYIPLGVVFALRWQLNPTQVKCTCNANESTYIPLGFSIKMRNIWGSVL